MNDTLFEGAKRILQEVDSERILVFNSDILDYEPQIKDKEKIEEAIFLLQEFLKSK